VNSSTIAIFASYVEPVQLPALLPMHTGSAGAKRGQATSIIFDFTIG
jgi:hypothetical protein